jgi:hypothetical protein
MAEPDGAHSIDCVWKASFCCFTCGKNCLYRFLTLLFGMFIALYWGCEFAYITFEQVWFITPGLRMFSIYMGCCQKCFGTCVTCFLAPVCETCGLMFSRVSISKQWVKHRPSDISNFRWYINWNLKKAVITVFLQDRTTRVTRVPTMWYILSLYICAFLKFISIIFLLNKYWVAVIVLYNQYKCVVWFTENIFFPECPMHSKFSLIKFDSWKQYLSNWFQPYLRIPFLLYMYLHVYTLNAYTQPFF